MSELSPEIKTELHRAIEKGDLASLRALRDTINAIDGIEGPEVVRVEFTRTQLRDLEWVRQNLKQPDIAAVLRMMVDAFMPGYKAAQKKNKT